MWQNRKNNAAANIIVATLDRYHWFGFTVYPSQIDALRGHTKTLKTALESMDTKNPSYNLLHEVWWNYDWALDNFCETFNEFQSQVVQLYAMLQS